MKYEKVGGKYKYRLTEDFIMETGIVPPKPILTEHVALSSMGTLWVISGWRWDGMSGWRDTKKTALPSLIHDIFCTLIRVERLPWHPYRRLSDELLYELCVTNGVSALESDLIYCAVRLYSDVKGLFRREHEIR